MKPVEARIRPKTGADIRAASGSGGAAHCLPPNHRGITLAEWAIFDRQAHPETGRYRRHSLFAGKEDFNVLLVFGAPCQLLSLAGPEHGPTISLVDIERLKSRIALRL